MKFKLDENLPSEFATIFREAAFEADTVNDENLSGADDSVIAWASRTEGRVLVTLDLDFANIHAYPPGDYTGIVVLRSKSQDKVTLISLLHRLIAVLRQSSPSHELWIVERDRIRIHRARG